MSELAPLIEDLAFILVLAGIVTIFCKKFNQPLVLGYILAGFFASPHFNLLPNVVDTANITVWSDIGVIFILFSLGLDFNLPKSKYRRHSADRRCHRTDRHHAAWLCLCQTAWLAAY